MFNNIFNISRKTHQLLSSMMGNINKYTFFFKIKIRPNINKIKRVQKRLT